MRLSTGSFGAVGEADVAQFDPRVGQLQRRLVVVGGLGGGAVDDLQQLARADQVAVQLDVEPRQPLGRLIGQQERGQEREELARRRAHRDHAVAAIHQPARDREAAERFHQRARAVGDPRHLVGVALDRADAGVDALAHGLFERERLDGADALQRFLHGLHDVGGAGELVVREALDPLHQLAQHQHRRRRHQEAEQRHIGILHHHHDDERRSATADRVRPR